MNRWAFAGLVLVAGAAVGVAAVDLRGVAVVLALALVVVSARWPQPMWLAVIPFALWPDELIVAGVPAQYVLISLVGLGACAGSAENVRAARKPLALTAALAGLIGISYLRFGDSFLLEPGETRNLMVALMVGLAVIPATAIIRPPLMLTLQVLAVSTVVASVRVFLTADVAGGRTALATYNSDGIGQAAAISLVLLVGLFAATKRPIWLLLTVAPAVVFMGAQTRAGLVMLVAGMVALWLFWQPTKAKVAVSLIMLAVTPFLTGPALAAQRALFSARDDRYLAVTERSDALVLAMRTMIEHPLSGVGYRHFPEVALRELGYAIDPHNDLARIGAEAGIAAFVIMVCLLARMVTFRIDGKEGVVLRAVLIASAGVLVFGNASTSPRVSFPLWLLLGVAWSLPTRRSADDLDGVGRRRGSDRRRRHVRQLDPHRV